LHLYNDDTDKAKYENEQTITYFLVISLGLWAVLTLALFCTIDLKFIGTFFGTTTGPQYVCELFRKSKLDSQKFDAIFTNSTQRASEASELFEHPQG